MLERLAAAVHLHDLNGLAVLVERDGADGHHASRGIRCRWPGREHFRLYMQVIARPHRFRPPALEAQANHPADGLEVAFDQQLHGDGGRVPAACRKPLEHRRARGLVVQMERLGIEFGRELFDLVRGDPDIA